MMKGQLRGSQQLAHPLLVFYSSQVVGHQQGGSAARSFIIYLFCISLFISFIYLFTTTRRRRVINREVCSSLTTTCLLHRAGGGSSTSEPTTHLLPATCHTSQVEGITIEILRQALSQAGEGRRHILGEMTKCSPPPRMEMSEYTPRVIRKPVGAGGHTLEVLINYLFI